MTSYLMFGSEVEPVTLEDAREFCGITDDSADSMLRIWIGQAREHVERTTGRALINQGWQMALHDWPASMRVTLPFAPLSKVIARLQLEDGLVRHIVPVTISEDDGVVVLPKLHSMPRLRPINGIEIDYVAGYGPTPDDVPEGLRVAVLLQVANYRRNGTAEADWTPSSVNYLTQKYRRAA